MTIRPGRTGCLAGRRGDAVATTAGGEITGG
ncbi:hypothetical protein BJ998_006036 [Kutzneria kofuensis]|uniref:Uncharacterized protein n=1 Tax=Kutzneria kofuensis TaxID=103725 RepID=A0A7W9KLN3_9PSEU|nr:hypothetical protein [Kutzneria kofuensis]